MSSWIAFRFSVSVGCDFSVCGSTAVGTIAVLAFAQAPGDQGRHGRAEILDLDR